MNKETIHSLVCVLLAGILLVACGGETEQRSSGAKLKVVATTTLVGDVVSQVGGDLIDLSVLLPPGMDPHSFNPAPQDVIKVAEADVVFANGAGLEEFLEKLIENVGAQARVVHVSDGTDFLAFESEGHEGQGHDDEESEYEGVDPHTWIDPNNVILWVHNIEHELSEVDPGNAGAYQANAKKYETELKDLDAWIREQVSQVPVENRKLVTDHALFGYFADEYGFEQVGALISGYSSLAQPSAQELAAIEDAIREYGVKAIFVGNTVNPVLAEQVARDTGVQLVSIYTGSLSEAGGEAETYLEYMQYNTSAIVNALK